MIPKSNLIVLVGGALLAANLFYDSTFAGLRNDVSTGGLSSSNITSDPVKMALVGLLTLVALTVVSEQSDPAANAILVALAAFWIMWLISYNSQKASTKKGASSVNA